MVCLKCQQCGAALDVGWNPDIVEASVKWDHIYQSTRDLDIFAASERIWLEPGSDFEELRKSNGNY